LSTESDWIIKQGFRVLKVSRNVPSQNCFTFAELENDRRSPLSRLTLASRLDLIGHGSRTCFERKSASTLATDLYSFGLRRVGVIKLQSCDGGLGNYLEHFLQNLNALGIQVGYLSAMKGAASDARKVINISGKDRVVKPFLHGPPKSVGSMPEYFGIRTIKGNASTRFSGTRYDIE
jgi:hypothetical protein